MSTGSSESQYGLRHVSCVPVWNGDILTCRDYDTAALRFRAGLKPGEQNRAVARLWANLQGPAKEVVAYKKIHACDQIRRRRGDVIGDHILRERRAFRQLTEALRRVRNARDEKTGARRRTHQTISGNFLVYSDAEYEMVEYEDTFTEAPWRQKQTGQTFFEKGNMGIPPSTECSSLWTRATDGTGWNQQRHGVRSCCDRGGKSFGKRVARFILPKLKTSGLLNRSLTASRVVEPRWK